MQKNDEKVTETTKTPSGGVTAAKSPSVASPPRSAATTTTAVSSPPPEVDEPLILDLSSSSPLNSNDTLFRTWRHEENDVLFRTWKHEESDDCPPNKEAAKLVVDTKGQDAMEEKDMALSHDSPASVEEPSSSSSSSLSMRSSDRPDASNEVVVASERKIATSASHSTTSPKNSFVRMPVATAAAAVIITATVVALLAVLLSLPVIRNGLCAPAAPWGTDLVEMFYQYYDAGEKRQDMVVLSSPWWAPDAFKPQAHTFVCSSSSSSKRTAIELQLEPDSNSKKKKMKDDNSRTVRLRMLAFEECQRNALNDNDLDDDHAQKQQQLVWEKRRLLSARIYADHLTIATLDRKQQRVQEDISVPWSVYKND